MREENPVNVMDLRQIQRWVLPIADRWENRRLEQMAETRQLCSSLSRSRSSLRTHPRHLSYWLVPGILHSHIDRTYRKRATRIRGQTDTEKGVIEKSLLC